MTSKSTNPPITPQSIWCCIPVHNNASTIVDVATRCRAQLPNVLVVDDGSTDADLVALLKPLDVTVIRHPTNQGKGAALLTAFEFAHSKKALFVLSIDADGQHYPEDIPRFLPHLSHDTLLIGRRAEYVGVMPDSSLFGREFSDFWITLETGCPVHDSQSGFRVYPLVLKQLHIESRRYNFEVEILTQALWAGLRVRSINIRVFYPEPKDRISSFKPLEDNLRIARLHARLLLRQIFPIPHNRFPGSHSEASLLKDLLTLNVSPIGLACAVSLGLLMGLVLGPWGLLIDLYLIWRLGFNRLAFLLPALLGATLLPLREFCMTTGQRLVGVDVLPRLAWFVGSHVVGLPLVLVVASLVYLIARRFQPLRA